VHVGTGSQGSTVRQDLSRPQIRYPDFARFCMVKPLQAFSLLLFSASAQVGIKVVR